MTRLAECSTTLADGLVFPEALRWHGGKIWFSDMHAQSVCTVSPGDGSVEVVLAIDDRPSGLGHLSTGDLLVVSMGRRQVLRCGGDGPTVYADLSPFTEHDCNDMLVVDDYAYVGTFGFDLFGGAPPAPTVLLRVAPDGVVSVAADDMWFPNGMAIAADGKLVIAESYAHQLTTFALSHHGRLPERAVLASLTGLGPDGIAVDADGCVWVAAAMDRAFLRVSPSGEIVDRIDCEGRIPVTCTLGGADGSVLYVSTTQHMNPQRCLAARTGRIHAVALA